MRFLLGCLLVVALSGCRGSSDGAAPRPTPSPAAAVDEAVRADLAAAFAGDQPGPEAASEGECFAGRLLATTTAEELREGGILDETYAVVAAFPELERELAEKVVDAQLGCTDFIDDSARAGIHVTRGGVAARAYVACLRRELPPRWIRAAVLAAVMGDWEDPAIDRLGNTQGSCARRAER